MGRVLVYSTVGCPHCVRALNLLRNHNVTPHIIDLTEQPERRDEMVRLSHGGKTVPQIFFNNDHVGGADDLMKLALDGELDEMLEKCLADEVELDVVVDEEAAVTSVQVDSVFYGVCDVLEFYDRLMYGTDKFKRKRRWGEKTKSFKGYQLIGELVENMQCTVGEAVDRCQKMMDLGFIKAMKSKYANEPFSNDKRVSYYFVEDGAGNTLNKQCDWMGEVRPATEVAADLQKRMLRIADLYIMDDGRSVDYARCGTSGAFREYRVVAMELQKVDLSMLSVAESMSFWLNLYNALVVHANIQLGPPKNMFERSRFFNGVNYVIGGHQYSLSVIEHGILRQNRKPPNSFSRLLKKTDPRFQFIAEEFNPCIHFALVCGAKSCPPIRVYDPANIHVALRWATEGFCSEEVTIDLVKRTITLSMLFKWYAVDFGRKTVNRLEWICQYLTGEDKQKLDSLILSGRYKVKFAAYNWDTNNRYDTETERSDGTDTISESGPPTPLTNGLKSTSPQDASSTGSLATGARVRDGRGRIRALLKQQHELDFAALEIQERIGSGGFGEVFLATYNGNPVAVKKMHQTVTANSAEMDSFIEEMNTISMLNHKHILKFVGVTLKKPDVCLVTEFAAKGDLYSLLRKKSLEWSMKLRIVYEIALAMEYLHSMKPAVLHRDLKSANVFIDEHNHVRIGDFGLSKKMKDNALNTKIGTVNFLAPEVLGEKTVYTEAADVFSFAMVMYEVLKERTPFSGMGALQVLRALDSGKRPSVRDTGRDEYVHLLKRCWRQNPTARPSFPQIVEELRAMLPSDPTMDASCSEALLDSDEASCTTEGH